MVTPPISKNSTVLVTGGAGYIGSHVVRELLGVGYKVKVIDDFSTGHHSRIASLPIDFFEGKFQDSSILTRALADVDSIIHLAASKSVEESMFDPEKYYSNNYFGTMKLINEACQWHIKRFVFSSSAAVYHPMPNVQLNEDSLVGPPSPYGLSKLLCEKLFESTSMVSQIQFTSLRYFNVIGSGAPNLGDTSTFNLVPKTLQRIENGLAPVINGNNLDTIDGTCVRDYVDVRDIADAHVRALENNSQSKSLVTYNLGSGQGFSVLEIIDTILKEIGKFITPEFGLSRPGDPQYLVASFEKINRELGWKPKYNLGEMIKSSVAAWRHSIE